MNRLLLIPIFWSGLLPVPAKVVEYDLHIAETSVSPAGKSVTGLTLNGTIPGPVLCFTEGDWARIRVHNDLTHHSTSTHWHGLLVPNAQDGVPEVTTPSIQPGTVHTFEFPIAQSGTYWYHSHTHFQEQQGLYGAIVIQPKVIPANRRADREHVLLLSDWTNENPHEIYRDLLRGSDWPGLKKGTIQSLHGAWQAGAVHDFFERERSRMKAMDLSDVAYDAFLINGRRTSTLTGKPGERILLRLINGSAATYHYVTSSTVPLTLIAADGQAVQPVKIERLLMAIGETYDVLITLPADGQYEIRTTAQDGSGHASAFIGEGTLHPATYPPRPDLYRGMDHLLEAALDEGGAAHGPRPAAPYPLLKSPVSTAFAANRAIREIPLRLTGDMERYIWSFNGRTTTEESVIPVKKGEILRLELINDTMMHHPIHLHGFFFRLINRHGTHSPLKHTVDVPPMGRHTIEFEANEEGDWMFHCHLLYHMMAGMSRVIAVRAPTTETDRPHSYRSTSSHHPTPPAAIPASPHAHSHSGGFSSAPRKAGIKQAEALGVNLGEHAHDMPALWGAASLQSHLSEGLLNYRQSRNDYNVMWEIGRQDTDDTEYEIDATAERWLGANFRAFAGARLTNIDDGENRAIAGFRYRLPYMIWSTLTIDSEGDARLILAKTLQLTARLSAFGKVQYDTGSQWEWATGAEYTLTKALSLTTSYNSDYGFGGGVVLRF